ncbi:MAG: hypothetical protein ACRC28_00900 [Clostridium sp.]|uniref:hypothetical protein n=1 Tax=Clostridia TaxID=186801 RepID=UPI003F417047
MKNNSLSWLDDFSNRGMVDISKIEEAFDVICNKLRDEYERKGMDSNVIIRDEQYMQLDEDTEIDFVVVNNCGVKFKVYKNSSVYKDDTDSELGEKYNITLINDSNKYKMYIKHNRVEGQGFKKLLKEFNELTTERVSEIVEILININL